MPKSQPGSESIYLLGIVNKKRNRPSSKHLSSGFVGAKHLCIGWEPNMSIRLKTDRQTDRAEDQIQQQMRSKIDEDHDGTKFE
jgi:hypothetical protein